MIKLLFLSHTGSGEPPMAEFIMKHLVKEAGLSEKIYVSSACLEKEGSPLCQEGKDVLAAHGIPATNKKALPLEWSTYDQFNYIFLMDNPQDPRLFNTMGGDVDNKISSCPQQPVMTAALPIPIKGPPLKKPSRLQTLPVRNSWRNIRTGSSRAPAERLRPAMGRQTGPRERVHGGTDGYKNALYGDGQRK